MILGDELDALAVKASRGDPEAFERLYHLLRPRILAWMRRFATVPASDTDDVFQQVISRVYRGLASYDPAQGAFLSWAHVVAHNEMRDQARTWREVDVTAPDRLQRRCDQEQAVSGARETEMARVLDRDHLRYQLERLTEREAQIVVLRYVIDLSLHDVADLLGISDDAVSQAQRRALRKLRQAHAQEDPARRSPRSVSRHPYRARAHGASRYRLHVFSRVVVPARAA